MLSVAGQTLCLLWVFDYRLCLLSLQPGLLSESNSEDLKIYRTAQGTVKSKEIHKNKKFRNLLITKFVNDKFLPFPATSIQYFFATI